MKKLILGVLSLVGSIIVPVWLLIDNSPLAVAISATIVMFLYSLNTVGMVGKKRGYNSLLDAFGYASLGNASMVLLYTLLVLIFARISSKELDLSLFLKVASYIFFVGSIAGLVLATRRIKWYKVFALSVALLSFCFMLICLTEAGVVAAAYKSLILKISVGATFIAVACGYKVMVYDVNHA